MECFRNVGDDTHVVLVDNTEPSHHEAVGPAAVANRVMLFRPPTNLGYFGGARYGLERAKYLGLSSDWVVVSNVDVRFSPSLVAAALAGQDPGKVGVVGPSIRSSLSNRDLNPFMSSRPSRFRMRAYRHIFATYWGFAAYSALSDFANRLRQRRVLVEREEAIYAAHGAFLIFSREFFARGGSLDHPPFLFGEEITVAERVSSLGLPILFLPQIRIVHEEHASTSRLPGKFHHRLMRDAVVYVADTYFL
jgi:GT2 family glycosyltransferase